MTRPSLKAENLRMSLGGVLLWDIQQLELQPHQLIHLTGANGSGKTTLLRVLAGLQKAQKGHIYIEDQPLQLGDGRCVYLHQQPYMFDKSVRDNLAWVVKSHQRLDKAMQEKIDRLLQWAGLETHAQQSARSLSGGERQSLAIARAALCHPKVWLLDEPLSNLDSQGLQRCLALIQTLREQGAAVIMSSHQAVIPSDWEHQVWVLKQQQLQVSQIDAKT